MHKALIISPDTEFLLEFKAELGKIMNESRIITSTSIEEGLFKNRHMNIDVMVLHHIFTPKKMTLFWEKFHQSGQPYRTPLIVLLPGKVSHTDQAGLLEKGADAILREPVNPDILKGQIKAMLRISDLEKKLTGEYNTIKRLLSETQLQLQRSGDINAQIYNILPIGIAIQKSGVINYANRAFIHILEKESDRIKGTPIREIFPSWDVLEERIKFSGEKEFHQTFLNTGKKKMAVHVSLLPLDRQEDSCFIVVMKSDYAASQDDFDNTLLMLYKLNDKYSDLDELIVHMLEFMKNTFYVDLVDIGMIDLKENAIRYFLQKGENNMPLVVPNYKTLSAQTLSFREPVLMNAEELTALADAHEIELLWNRIPEEWLGIPLINNGEVIGILELLHYGSRNNIATREINHIKLIAGNISALLDARLKEIKLRYSLKEAQKADKLKSHFLSNISHEVRTPLNAIIGFSSLLEEVNDVQEVKEYSRLIAANGDQLVRILDNLVELSKLESGDLTLNKMDTSLEEIFTNLEEQFYEKNARNGKDIKLVVQHDEQLKGQVIKTDPYRLQEVVNHLLDNAYKFTVSGTITMGYHYDGSEQIMLFVEDTGIGIPEEKRDVIFEQFVQVEEGDIRDYGGTGVGLTISQKLIRLMGGEIEVFSEEGKGTRLEITLPAELPKFSRQKPMRSVYNWSGKKILLVDDVDSNLEFLDMLISQTGAQTLWASNGEKAVQQVENHDDIDVVLMDIQMPVMDGYTATRIIKNRKPDLPVIAQTAFTELSDKKKAFDSGVSDYLQKPINPQKLLATINNFLSGRQQVL